MANHTYQQIIAVAPDQERSGPGGLRGPQRDIPGAELHLLDIGHFALEDKLDEMVPQIRGFLERNLT